MTCFLRKSSPIQRRESSVASDTGKVRATQGGSQEQGHVIRSNTRKGCGKLTDLKAAQKAIVGAFLYERRKGDRCITPKSEPFHLRHLILKARPFQATRREENKKRKKTGGRRKEPCN